MDILEIAIKAEGGVGKLAAALGENQNTVSNWRARGKVPRGWARVIAIKYAKAIKAAQNDQQPAKV